MFNPQGQRLPRASLCQTYQFCNSHSSPAVFFIFLQVRHTNWFGCYLLDDIDYKRLCNLICCSLIIWFWGEVWGYVVLHPSHQRGQTPLLSLWALWPQWFLFCKVLIFICDNKCPLLRHQHTIPFSFTTPDVAQIGFCRQMVPLMVSFLLFIEISSPTVSFLTERRRLQCVAKQVYMCLIDQADCLF